MKTAEELLRRLLGPHFYTNGNNLVWSYLEGTGIADVDPELALDLREWLGAEKNPQPAPVQAGPERDEWEDFTGPGEFDDEPDERSLA